MPINLHIVTGYQRRDHWYLIYAEHARDFKGDEDVKGNRLAAVRLNDACWETQMLLYKTFFYSCCVKIHQLKVVLLYTVSQKKLCKIVSVRTSSNFHKFS